MGYRALNAQTISNLAHPIPLIEDLLDRLGNAHFFSTLDLKSKYHQMPIRDKDKELTAFVGTVPMEKRLLVWPVRSPINIPTDHDSNLGDSQYEEVWMMF